MDLRIELTYSRKYIGVYSVTGSAGHMNLDRRDTIDEWLGDNSLGKVDWGLGKKAQLIYGNGVMAAVRSSVEEMRPSDPADGQEFNYKRQVKIRFSPPGANLPRFLQVSLKERGLGKK